MQIMLKNINEVDVKILISHCSKRNKILGVGWIRFKSFSRREMCSLQLAWHVSLLCLECNSTRMKFALVKSV